MFITKLLSVVPTEVEKMLLEQQETLRKLEEIKNSVEKIKNGSMQPSVGQMYDASNTLKNPVFDIANISWIEKAENFFTAADKFINWVTHPVMIVNSIAGISFYVAVVVGLTGLIFYIIGYKKGMKYVVGSLVGYTLIQIINFGVSLL
jgi:hypothetical protein